MSQPREYQSASIEVTLGNGCVDAILYGYFPATPETLVRRWDSWDLDPSAVLTEYTKRCAAAARQHPEMSPEQAERAALLAWVKDMEAVVE